MREALAQQLGAPSSAAKSHMSTKALLAGGHLCLHLLLCGGRMSSSLCALLHCRLPSPLYPAQVGGLQERPR